MNRNKIARRDTIIVINKQIVLVNLMVLLRSPIDSLILLNSYSVTCSSGCAEYSGRSRTTRSLIKIIEFGQYKA